MLTAGGLYACVPWETKHNLEIITPVWFSMMRIIPVWRADREKLSEERRSSCWSCLERGWIALGGYTFHTFCVFSEDWVRHLTWFYKDFSVFEPSRTTGMLRYLQRNLAISYYTIDILDFGHPGGGGETLGRKYIWRTRGRWGQNLHVPPQFRHYCFNTTQQWKLRTRVGQ